MNTFILIRKQVLSRTFAALTVASLLLSLFPVQFVAANGQGNKPEDPGDPQVTICHANNGAKGYNPLKISASAVLSKGHQDHHDGGPYDVGDIIPVINPGLLEGKNLDVKFGDKTGADWLAEGKCPPAPYPTGSITIIKDAGEDAETEFEFTGSLDTFTLVGGSDTGSDFADIEADEYTITESEVEGWILEDITCSGEEEEVWSVSDSSVTIDLEEDDDITCTFTNRPEPPADKDVTIVASKIVCDDEALLPNGTYYTPADFLSSSPERAEGCEAVSGWEFQWTTDTVYSKDTDQMAEYLGGNWHTSDMTVDGDVTIELDEDDLDGSTHISIREAFQPGYIPFTRHGENDGSDVTAELYCENDSKFFDNMEWLDDVELGDTFRCTAWNVPEPQNPTECTVTIKSDDTDTVVEKSGDAAKILSFVHTNWVKTLPTAKWIWGDDPVVNPLVNETQTFVKQFGWGGDTITSATLKIASDNSFVAMLNDDLAGQDAGEHNYEALKTIDVTELISEGNNELEVAVENFGLADSTAESNPAGLYYELTITGTGEACDIPYEPPYEPPAEPGYCGDDKVNQAWEQCDGEDGLDEGESCTEYCTVANQCQDLRLVKITLDEDHDSPSFDASMIYLGSDSNPIPNGTWFNLDETDTEAIDDIAKAVEGLAVVRDPANGEIEVANWGDNDQGYDKVVGTVEVLGMTVAGLLRDLQGVSQFALETAPPSNHTDYTAMPDAMTVTFDWQTYPIGDGMTLALQTGEEYDCPVQPATYTIDGYKYELPGVEGPEPYEGWLISLTDDDDEVIATTTTDEYGYYSFEVEAGSYEVHEGMLDDWEQIKVEKNLVEITGDYCAFVVPVEVQERSLTYQTTDYLMPDYQCDFYNEEIDDSTDPDPEIVYGCMDPKASNYNKDATDEGDIKCKYNNGRSGSGTRTDRYGRGGDAQGMVAGASTDLCPFIEDYMQMGWNNDPLEVRKLQLFLNNFRSLYGGTENPVTGHFGVITDANVKAFQEHYRGDILDPWYMRGIVPHQKPTGFVYKTTLWKINSIVCPDYAILPDFTGENLQSNIALDVPPVQD